MKKQTLFSAKVEIAFSENSDGSMRYFGGEDEAVIIKNQQNLAEQLGLKGDRTARIRTIYGDRKYFTKYYEITKQNISEFSINNSETAMPVCDGIATKEPDLGILLPLADCLGIVVYDAVHGAIGLLHAGRQNIEQFGPQKFVEFFEENYKSDPTKLEVYFSPHALGYQILKINKTLSEAAMEQLITAGVLSKNITDDKIDTTNNENLPSHSSGDKTKRFAFVVKQN